MATIATFEKEEVNIVERHRETHRCINNFYMRERYVNCIWISKKNRVKWNGNKRRCSTILETSTSLAFACETIAISLLTSHAVSFSVEDNTAMRIKSNYVLLNRGFFEIFYLPSSSSFLNDFYCRARSLNRNRLLNSSSFELLFKSHTLYLSAMFCRFTRVRECVNIIESLVLPIMRGRCCRWVTFRLEWRWKKDYIIPLGLKKFHWIARWMIIYTINVSSRSYDALCWGRERNFICRRRRHAFRVALSRIKQKDMRKAFLLQFKECCERRDINRTDVMDFRASNSIPSPL
jgi:hypothetical protein